MSRAVLEWEFRPWRDEPARAWGATAALAACVAVLALIGLPLLLKAALFIVMGLALEPAYLASRFRVDGEGFLRATRLGQVRLPWTSARRWRRYRTGVEVGTAGPSWLPAAGRRLRLDIPPRERERVLAVLEEQRSAHGG